MEPSSKSFHHQASLLWLLLCIFVPPRARRVERKWHHFGTLLNLGNSCANETSARGKSIDLFLLNRSDDRMYCKT